MRFYLMNLHMSQEKEVSLDNVRAEIRNSDVVSSRELGKCVRNPEGPWGWLLGKNEIRLAGNHGLSGYALISAFRRSRIVSWNR